MSIQELMAFHRVFKNDILKFSEVVCSDVVTGEVPQFHKDLYKLALENERLAVAAPRGFAKSTILAKIYPLWLALYGHKKDICIISASETLAIDHLRYIKTQLESNPKITSVFPDLRSEKWTESHICLKHPLGFPINLRAKGAGGQIRGFRPDCIILDDIETDESVESEEQRKKIKTWLFKACLNTLLPKGQMLLIGTLIHPLSVLADLLDMPNDWTKRKYQAYVDGIEEEGHELWGKARPHVWLQQRKAEIGSWAFAAEFMNNPMSDESAPLKESMIRYWKELPDDLNLCITVDPAYSDEERSDYKVAALVGIDRQYNRYLCHYIRTHSPQGEFIDALLNLYLQNRDRVTGIGVPSSGVEKEFFRSVVNRVNERKMSPPIIELKNVFTSTTGGSVRNKKSRIIASLQPLFEQGKYFIGKDHIEARDELLTIGSSRWDDLVDAMAYAEQILVPNFTESGVKFDRYGEPEEVGREFVDAYGY